MLWDKLAVHTHLNLHMHDKCPAYAWSPQPTREQTTGMNSPQLQTSESCHTDICSVSIQAWTSRHELAIWSYPQVQLTVANLHHVQLCIRHKQSFAGTGLSSPLMLQLHTFCRPCSPACGSLGFWLSYVKTHACHYTHTDAQCQQHCTRSGLTSSV